MGATCLWMLLSGVSTFMAVGDGAERKTFSGVEKLWLCGSGVSRSDPSRSSWSTQNPLGYCVAERHQSIYKKHPSTTKMKKISLIVT